MKYPALSYGVTHRYPWVWPVLGRSGLTQDYPELFRVAHRLVGSVRHVLSHPRWWRSRKVYSHTTVVWSTGWTVNVYAVSRLRRRSRREPRLRERRRPRRSIYAASTQWWRRPSRRMNHVTLPGLWHRLVRVVRQRRKYLTITGATWWATEVTRQVGHPVRWRWIHLRQPIHGGASTFLAVVRYGLRGRGLRGMAGVVRPLLRSTQRAPRVVGACIRCAGRFGRKQRAEHKVYRWGQLSRSGVGAPVEQARLTIPLRFGMVAVTLTINLAG